MAFTEAQRVDIRRHCGFAMFGGVPTQAFGYRYFTRYGTLEFRVNNASPEEETVITDTYLANCNQLEVDLMGASVNLDTDQAAVWKHNKNEVRDRDALLRLWRLKLCSFLGLEGGGPGLNNSGGIELVV
jgi:hypothetical protein